MAVGLGSFMAGGPFLCFVGMQEAEATGKVGFEVVDMRRSLPKPYTLYLCPWAV